MPNPHPYAAAAVRHLRRSDRALAPVLDRVGAFAMRRLTDRFAALAWSIVSQQISIHAAASIRRRLLELFKPRKRLDPAALLALEFDTLRGIGLSRAKTAYIRDLAERVAGGHINLRGMHHRSDDEVIELLTEVKGIGRWTAEMFLIFSLGRPDVLPVDDYGLRVAVQRLDGRKELPKPSDVRQRGEAWRPYRSVATWYLWQSLKKEAM
jgi:3-methyladenine DNA glycosylase/8-oxoguanine DNA glycosylase